MDRPQVGVEAHETVSRGPVLSMHQRIEPPCFPTVISTNPAIVVNNTLEQALALASPRILPRRSTLASTLIHSSVVVLWLLLFARAFFLRGALAWSTGIAYVVYDTLLLIFVINKQSFGWTIQFHWPVAVLLGSLTVVYLATVLAGLFPARLAVRLDPMEVVHEE